MSTAESLSTEPDIIPGHRVELKEVRGAGGIGETEGAWRRGTEVRTILEGQINPIYSRIVWQRGSVIPRPFFELRARRAMERADRIGAAAAKVAIKS